MRLSVALFVVFAMLSITLNAQDSVRGTKSNAEKDFNSIAYLSSSNPDITRELQVQFEEKLNNYLKELRGKQAKQQNEKKFLEYLFFKTHKVFLKKYDKYTDFAQMLSTGNYDCLSGSLLYAYLLDRLGYEYQINETLYHVYVTVQTSQEQYLFESTDPLHGFVCNKKEIATRVAFYINGQSTSSTFEGISSNEYQFQSEAVAEIGLKEAGALQFYNQAIVDYNNKDLAQAYLKIEKALLYYRSPRIEEMLAVVSQTIAHFDGMNLEEKDSFLRKFASYHQKKKSRDF